MLGLFACASAQEVAPATATSVPPTIAPTTTPERAAMSVGEPLHGYVNVAYTQADGNLIGKTKRAQMINIYATW